jgi:uncharacterized protein YbaR (Trm112 family)
MPVDPKLLDLLACPKCKGPLDYRTATPEGFSCVACELFFRVEEGIPNFLIEEASPLSSVQSSA